MRGAIGGTGEPFPRSLLSTINAGAGKLLDKGEQQLFQLPRTDLPGEVSESIDHHVGIKALAIARHEGVAGFIDQAHGIECTGIDDALRMLLDIPNQIHPVGEFTACRDVRENNISGKGEEIVRKLIAGSYISGDMEFHHLRIVLGKACQPSCQMRRDIGIRQSFQSSLLG